MTLPAEFRKVVHVARKTPVIGKYIFIPTAQRIKVMILNFVTECRHILAGIKT
jgi:hypothetical protein